MKLLLCTQLGFKDFLNPGYFSSYSPFLGYRRFYLKSSRLQKIIRAGFVETKDSDTYYSMDTKLIENIKDLLKIEYYWTNKRLDSQKPKGGINLGLSLEVWRALFSQPEDYQCACTSTYSKYGQVHPPAYYKSHFRVIKSWRSNLEGSLTAWRSLEVCTKTKAEAFLPLFQNICESKEIPAPWNEKCSAATIVNSVFSYQPF